MWGHATQVRMPIARVLLAVLPLLGVAGCAKEPPEENYQSLKDQWTDRTTVAREGESEPEPVQVVYTFPPKKPDAIIVEPTPAPRQTPLRSAKVPLQPVPSAPAPVRPKPPSLAISPPAVQTPPPVARPAAPTTPATPAPPLPPALTEADLTNCGPGADCLAVLRAMLADPTQSWMVRAPTPEEFANGTRLFAYRALKSTLECGKLRFANAELDWAVDTFKSGAEKIDPAHRARVAALAEAVRAEIAAEIKRRC
jgi:hypothetical protein